MATTPTISYAPAADGRSEAEATADRGAHEVLFQSTAEITAIKDRTGYLPWGTSSGGELTLPLDVVLKLTVAFMTGDDDARG